MLFSIIQKIGRYISLKTGYAVLLVYALTPAAAIPSDIKPDETVIFPASYGWYRNGELNIQLRAWIFELEENSILRKSFSGLLQSNIENISNEEKGFLDNRIKYFLADNQRGKVLKINISGEIFILSATSASGHCVTTFNPGKTSRGVSENQHISFSTLTEKGDNRSYNGKIQIISEEGFSVISDIDDTIKISNVRDRDELISSTFLRRFKSVPGMSQFYNRLKSDGAVFHYVSGSPWQLYPSIAEFITNEGFPEGSFELKMFRVKDENFISFIYADQMSFKLNAIKTIIDRFPGRKFVLVGDSGERDPEIYSEIAYIYRERIRSILIRDVGHIEPGSERRSGIIKKAEGTEIIFFKYTSELDKFSLNKR